MNVVSFYAPRPEHPFFQDYRPYLALLRASCERFGHRHLVLTDDPMEVGADDAYIVDLPRSLMKAVLVAQHAYLADPANAHTPTLLVGADCVLARDPEEHFPTDCDLAITVGDFTDCRMNTGAIFIPHPCQVAEIWAEAVGHVGDDWGDDQTALYQAILQRPWHGVWTARVTELPVDPFNLAPDNPGDDCTRGVVLHFRGPRKAWMTDYCKKWLDLGEGVELRIAPNTSEKLIMENVRINAVRSRIPAIKTEAAHDGHAVLVGGGPSLASMLSELRRRHASGQTFFALNGVGEWLERHGIRDTYRVVLDPRPENARFVTRRGFYLLASQCHPDVFDAALAHGSSVSQWHFMDSGKEVEGAHLIGGGITVGLTAMGLAFAMGYRKLHLYGYDSSEAEDQLHAYEQCETVPEARRLEVWVGSRSFITNPAMYAQAKAFEGWANLLADNGALITVHGDGLLPAVARAMETSGPVEGAMAV